MHDALHTAMVQVQSKVGEFSALFAPQSDDTKIILAIFDGLTTILGFSLPAMFNVGEYGKKSPLIWRSLDHGLTTVQFGPMSLALPQVSPRALVQDLVAAQALAPYSANTNSMWMRTLPIWSTRYMPSQLLGLGTMLLSKHTHNPQICPEVTIAD